MTNRRKPEKTRERSKIIAAVALLAAIVAGIASFIANTRSIGEATGIISKYDSVNLDLSFSSIFYGIGNEGLRNATLIGKINKIGIPPAKNCMIHAEWDGYQLPVEVISYGNSFSLPSGNKEQGITVTVSPNVVHIGLKSPTVFIICDNAYSQPFTFDFG